MMGMFSAVLGGVIRDVLLREIPLIFRKEIYALACIAGGILFVFLQKYDILFEWNAIITISFIVLIRLLVIKFKIGLPGINEDPMQLFKKDQ